MVEFSLQMLTVRVTSMLSRTSLSYENSNVNGGFWRQSVKTHTAVAENFRWMVMVSLSQVVYGVKSAQWSTFTASQSWWPEIEPLIFIPYYCSAIYVQTISCQKYLGIGLMLHILTVHWRDTMTFEFQLWFVRTSLKSIWNCNTFNYFDIVHKFLLWFGILK